MLLAFWVKKPRALKRDVKTADADDTFADVAKTINALMPKQKNYDGAPTKAVYIESMMIETAKAPPSPSASPSK